MGGLSWAVSVNRYWFMILALISLNRSFAAVRRDSRSAPAHWGNVKIEFLTECIQHHGDKEGCLLSAQGLGWGCGGGDPQNTPTVFFSLPYFRTFLLSLRRAIKDSAPYLGLSRFVHMFSCACLWDS